MVVEQQLLAFGAFSHITILSRQHHVTLDLHALLQDLSMSFGAILEEPILAAMTLRQVIVLREGELAIGILQKAARGPLDTRAQSAQWNFGFRHGLAPSEFEKARGFGLFHSDGQLPSTSLFWSGDLVLS